MPKDHVGLGAKNTQLLNNAFIFKMLQNLLTNINDLQCQCQVLINKYDKKKNTWENMIKKPNDFPLWESLVKVWDKFQKNILRGTLGTTRGLTFGWINGDKDKKFYVDNAYIYLTTTSNAIETNVDWSII